MRLNTIDHVVRNALADKEYPIHFYIQFLTYAVDGLRELEFDVMQRVKSVKLPVREDKSVKLPCDFVDYVRIGVESGQHIATLGERESLNRLVKTDDAGNRIARSDASTQSGWLPANFDGLFYTNYANDKGELLGRMFNIKPAFKNSFIVVRERGEIQLDSAFQGKEIVLDYITDGLDISASNAVHPYAIDTIKNYIFWKQKEHGRHYSRGEVALAKDEYYNSLRILKGRMNPMDDVDIKRSLAGAYGATIKF